MAHRRRRQRPDGDPGSGRGGGSHDANDWDDELMPRALPVALGPPPKRPLTEADLWAEGPPATAEEYLRRVRWVTNPTAGDKEGQAHWLIFRARSGLVRARWGSAEAAARPDVVTKRPAAAAAAAAAAPTPLHRPPSARIPAIAERPAAPPGLAPSSEWIDAFVASFASLRQVPTPGGGEESGVSSGVSHSAAARGLGGGTAGGGGAPPKAGRQAVGESRGPAVHEGRSVCAWHADVSTVCAPA